MKLNFGCGDKILPGHINIDKVNLPGVDIVHDLNVTPYPFEDDYFDKIIAHDVIEHLSIDTDVLMKELHRIMKKEGVLDIIVPHYTNQASYFCQHKKVFASRSFDGYIEGHGYNRCYDFAFLSIKKKIRFMRGFSSIYNIPMEMIADFSIPLYEDTPLSAFPAKRLEFEIIK